MPEAARFSASSGTESDPECPMESESAIESSRRRRKKEKKEKKSKRHDKSRRRKTQTDESEQSEDDIDPPKLKKSRSGVKQNGHTREESPENAKLSTLNSKSSHKKRHSNSSETSSGDGDSEPEQEMTEEQKEGAFSNFSISKGTVQLLQARGVTYLFPVQVKTFNPVYSGKDVIAQARTGTGKTFSFAIPLIEKLQGDSQERRRGRSPKVLVLCPTRELANQVAKDFKDITKKLTVACFYGGTPYNGQIDLMRSGIDILVGTPGRIKDHLQNGKLDLTKVKHVVLDEVDQMLDMGFAEQVEDILRVAYKKDSEDNPQTLLFSATCPHWVYDVAKKYMKSRYEQIDLIGKRTQKAATTVEHLAIECHWSQRAAVIGDVIQVYSGSYGRTIVFCETKKEANELALNASIKQDCQSLHGDIPQKQREITLKGFRNGTFKVLVATNVAARGLDIPEVDLVVQSSPPKDVESYIHRSGRTGRAGRTGICICFYQRKEEHQLRYVEQKAGITFKRVGVPTATDIIKASSKDAIRCLDSVPQTAIEYFKESARFLIEEKGPVNALAAALAHISGATSIEQRSLLNSDVGFVTMILSCSEEINNMSYAWRKLRELLGDDVDRKVNRMCFLKGKMGVCFDIPAADQKDIEAKWEDSKQWRLCVATELPELVESQRGGGGSGGNGRSFSSSRSGRRGGSAARAAAAPVSDRRRLAWLWGARAGPLLLLAAALPRGPGRLPVALGASPHFLRAEAGHESLGHRYETGSGSAAHLPGEQSAVMPAAGPAASPAEPQAPAGAETLRRGRRRKVKQEETQEKKRREKVKRRVKADGEQAQPEESGLGDGDLDPPLPKKTKKIKEKSHSLAGESNGSEHTAKPSSAASNDVTSLAVQSAASNTAAGEQDSDTEELTEEAKEGDFSNFPLSQNTINLLKAQGVKYLFPVQVRTFQPIYDGKDVIAQARTGTGKTISFALPLIEKLQSVLLDGRRGRMPKALVLVPTRELATQVAKDFKNLTKKLSVACFYGGTPYKEQIDLLRSGIDILVGTPGRIKDHIQNSKLELSSVKHVVLDEVDHMLDMGFAEQVEEILGFAYKKGSENNPQTLLFSATCPRWVYDVAKKYMKDDCERIDLIGKKAQRTATTVEHLAIQCRSSQRAGVLGDIIQVYSGSHGRTIVFCETKKEANELAMNASLKQDAQSLHGDIPQKQREITLKGFRDGVFEVLIATNVAARGLDIPEVDLVIQCSPPKDVDSYIHRSGRTGRAGRTGVCICLFQRREEDLLKQVEHKAGITFKRVGVPSATDVIEASSHDAKKLLEAIPPSAVDYFRKSAQELIDEKGAVAALAAALAHISGASYIQQRSLLNSTAGFVTMVLKCSIEMHTMSYAWRGLKEQLGEEVDSKVSSMRFLKGKMGVCFDVPVGELSNIQEQWTDTRRWQLSVAKELPELEEYPQEAGRGFSRFGNGRQGGGGFKRNNWSKNGNRWHDFNK